MAPTVAQTPPTTPRQSVLVIEDDRELVALMSEYLSTSGFHVAAAYDGREGLRRAVSEPHDLIILDMMLPHLDGTEVLTQVRRRSQVPVIVLTARTSREDRVRGLQIGADDYLCKPFAPEELIARMRAVLRRVGHPVGLPAVVRIGNITLNPRTRRVDRAGIDLQLTQHEFDVLDLLMRSAGRVVSREEIASALYHRELMPFERSLDVHISHLRKKLEQGDKPLITAIRGAGYMFRPE